MKYRSPAPQSLSLLIVGLMAVLSLIGLVFVFEASVTESFATYGDRYFQFKNHLIGFVIAWLAFVAGLMIPSRFWIKTAPLWVIAAVVLMAAVFVPGIGLNLNGASRWISIGGLTLQPVEFFKFALIAYLAAWLPTNSHLKPFLLVVAIPVVLLLLQPDLGSLLVVLSIAVSMYFISGKDLKKMVLVAAAAIPLVAGAILFSPYRMQRLLTFFNPESDPLGSSFHIRQIVLALGRGGLFGQGIGNSTQRFSYIPEAATDSIFAIVAEELGFAGSAIIITLFIVMLLAMFKVVTRTSNPLEIKLLGTGIAAWITAQTALNLSAIVALVPLTGIPLPFFSYGRSALIMILFASGVLLRTGKKI
jgi:cell division protein FtsW